uniref:NmrA-like domain-containing protein n=1 Tax=Arcella intermedia TaxID=1963864 RepID=A0A6B2LC38_9EUKA
MAQDGKYRLRGVSKETDVPRYRDLEQSGIEMVKANIATGEGLEEAFRDAQVAFIVLPSFDKEIIGKEYNYGTTLIEKAKYHGIRTLIFSTAVNTSDISGKKYCIPHFDEKARVEEYIRAIQKTKDAFDHVAFVAPSFYFQNFSWKSFAPKQMGDHHVFRFPHVGVLTGCDIHDLGYVVKEVIENPKKYDNRTIILNSEEAPLQDYIQKYEEITQNKARLEEISIDEFKKNPDIHHKEELGQMFEFINDYTYFGKDRPDYFLPAREVYPHLKTWGCYLKESPLKQQT